MGTTGADESEAKLEELLHAAAATGDHGERARLLIAACEHLDMTNRSRHALVVAVDAGVAADASGDDTLRARVLLRQSIAHSNLGELTESIAYGDEARGRFRAAGETLGLARTEAHVAGDLIESGRADEGIDVLVAATIALEGLPDPTVELADSLVTVARAHIALKSFTTAYELSLRALAIGRALNATADLAWYEYISAETAWVAGEHLLGNDPAHAAERFRAAMEHAQESIRQADRSGYPQIRALGLLFGGHAVLRLGDAEAARSAFAAARAGGVHVDSPPEAALLLLGEARVASALADTADAIAAYAPAIASIGDSSYAILLPRALADRAALHEAGGDLTAALDDVRGAGDAYALRAEELLRGRTHDLQARLELARARRDIERHERATQEALLLAAIDELTGLPNRRAFVPACRAVLERDRELGAATSLAVIDVDHFKRINDDRSHLVGDEVLCRVGRILRTHARACDLVHRYAGDEFIVVLPGADRAIAEVVCRRLRDAVVAEAWDEIADELAVGVTIGLATAAVDSEPWVLFAVADAELLTAKREERGTIRAA